jgi:transcriptional antiterminator NusG
LIRIRNIDAASGRIVADYSDLAGWYCLTVRPRGEFAVEKDLDAAGVIACVPRRMGEEKVHRGRKLPAPVLPVIAGYLLVRCVPSAAAFTGLRSIDRVTGIVGRGEVPYRLPEKKIQHFISMAKAGEYDHRDVKVTYLPGENVVVTDGPFASFPGVVVAIDEGAGRSRINVEVNIFGRPTPVELDVAQVAKL